MVDPLKVEIGQDNVGFTEINLGVNFVGLMIDGLRQGRPVSDEIYAQSFLDYKMSLLVQESAMRRGQVESYARSFESIATTVYTIARSFSINQIQEICQNGEDILNVLRVHHNAIPLLPYISRLII